MTLPELRIAALQEAGILAAAESPSAEDDVLVTAKYAALYDMLLSEGLVAWAASDDLPDYASVPLTMMLAAVIAPAFGIEGQKLADLRQGYAAAERMLRRQLAKHYVSHPVRSEYF